MSSKFDEIASKHLDSYYESVLSTLTEAYTPGKVYKVAQQLHQAFLQKLEAQITNYSRNTPPPTKEDLEDLERLKNTFKQSGVLEFGGVAKKRASLTPGTDENKVAAGLYNLLLQPTAYKGFGLRNYFDPVTTPGVAKSPKPPGAKQGPKTPTSNTSAAIGQKIVAGHKEILNTLDKSAPTIQTR